MVRSIRCDQVIDYLRGISPSGGQRYDLIFDCVLGTIPCQHLGRVLNPEGIVVMVGERLRRAQPRILSRLITALLCHGSRVRKAGTFLARQSHRTSQYTRAMQAGK